MQMISRRSLLNNAFNNAHKRRKQENEWNSEKFALMPAMLNLFVKKVNIRSDVYNKRFQYSTFFKHFSKNYFLKNRAKERAWTKRIFLKSKIHSQPLRKAIDKFLRLNGGLQKGLKLRHFECHKKYGYPHTQCNDKWFVFRIHPFNLSLTGTYFRFSSVLETIAQMVKILNKISGSLI